MSEYPPLDGEALLRVLDDAAVEHILIGGIAVIAHGYARTTRDIDIVPEPSRENLRRLERVLNELEYELAGTEDLGDDELVPPTVDNLEAGGNWVLITRLGGLDILQFIEPGIDYTKLAEDAIEDTAFGIRVRICGYDDLVAMKERAGRPQDLADIARLRAIRGESDGQP